MNSEKVVFVRLRNDAISVLAAQLDKRLGTCFVMY